MDRDEIARQGKQIAADLRDTVGQKVSENQGTIKGTLGRAAAWVDEKTGGKYSEQIGKARTRVDEGVDRLAAQEPTAPPTGTPTAPGATAGDPPVGTTAPTASGPREPITEDLSRPRPSEPVTQDFGHPQPPTETPTVPPTPQAAQPPQTGVGDDRDLPGTPRT